MIFVNIASYRDPEGPFTVRDLFSRARYPDQINVGMFLQASPEDNLEFAHDRMKLTRINYHESKGACWARSQAYKFYDGEDYVLQIDSHMRFEQHWDIKLLEQLRACRVAKPIISHYPPAYEPPNVLVGGNDTACLGAKEFRPDGMLDVQGLVLNPRPRYPRPSAFLGAGFIFGDARWIKEVPYDPWLYFWGEEPTLAVRFWTHGWDIFAPSEVVIWHRYSRPDPAHWGDHPTWPELNDRSIQRVRHLFGLATATPEALIDFDRYGLGTERSLDDYERFIGVNYQQRTIEERSKAADYPLPNRPLKWATQALHLSPPMTLAMESNTRMETMPPDEIDWAVFEGVSWGGTESVSGPGSSLDETGHLRARLPEVFKQLAIRSLVDAPCGDMNWMRHVSYEFDEYIGVDLVPRLIEKHQKGDFPKNYRFMLGNIVTDLLPTADAILCRDCLVHLPFAAIQQAVKLWKQAGFKYVFATTFFEQKVNVEIQAGAWRMLNMQLAPFYWPAPLLLLPDNDKLSPPYDSKSIGVWQVADIPT